jgi:hypothetical protein
MGANRPGAAVPGRGVKRADPTEPEVPSAKRVRATRRQRSAVVAGAAMVALLVIVLFLLYKTGRHVTTLPADPTSPVAGGIGSVSQPALPNSLDVPPVRPADTPTAGVQPTVISTSTASVAPKAGPAAPRAKGSAQAKDIFRKPAF